MTNLKQLKQLIKHKKHRDQSQHMVLQGPHLIQEYLKHYSTKKIEKYFDLQPNDQIPTEKQQVITHTQLRSISDTQTPQPPILVVPQLKPQRLTAPLKTKKITILCDHIQDPGNLGTIIRTAVCTGVTDIVMTSSCASLCNPKTIRASQGALMHPSLNFWYLEPSLETLNQLPKPINILDAGQRSIFDPGTKITGTLVFGSEGQGVSDFFKQHSDSTFSIPMENGFESLNVGVTASIALYQWWQKKNQ